jgi:hypothetical protein
VALSKDAIKSLLDAMQKVSLVITAVVIGFLSTTLFSHEMLPIGSLRTETVLLWALAILVVALLLSPAIAYLRTAWNYRKDEILAGMSDTATMLYFRQFHPQDKLDQGSVQERFERYYDYQFGRRHFIFPLILLLLINFALMPWTILSLIDWLGLGAKAVDVKTANPGDLPLLAVVAVSGAYLYCISEQIQHWRSWDLLPSDLLWMSFRLVFAVPTAYALSSLLNPQLAQPAAFLIGTFPTNTLMTILRRLAVKRLGVDDVPESGETELLGLQGIDLRNSERFSGENITTVLKLACADPVKLAIRTSLGYTYIVDCISQALLCIYVRKEERDNWIRVGLRGAIEVRSIWLRIKSEDEKERAINDELIVKIAGELKREVPIMKNVFEQ